MNKINNKASKTRKERIIRYKSLKEGANFTTFAAFKAKNQSSEMNTTPLSKKLLCTNERW
jgi:hypothetical protein